MRQSTRIAVRARRGAGNATRVAVIKPSWWSGAGCVEGSCTEGADRRTFGRPALRRAGSPAVRLARLRSPGAGTSTAAVRDRSWAGSASVSPRPNRGQRAVQRAKGRGMQVRRRSAHTRPAGTTPCWIACCSGGPFRSPGAGTSTAPAARDRTRWRAMPRCRHHRNQGQRPDRPSLVAAVHPAGDAVGGGGLRGRPPSLPCDQACGRVIQARAGDLHHAELDGPVLGLGCCLPACRGAGTRGAVRGRFGGGNAAGSPRLPAATCAAAAFPRVGGNSRDLAPVGVGREDPRSRGHVLGTEAGRRLAS